MGSSSPKKAKVTVCSGHGACSGDGTSSGSGSCDCDMGYAGVSCEIDLYTDALVPSVGVLAAIALIATCRALYCRKRTAAAGAPDADPAPGQQPELVQPLLFGADAMNVAFAPEPAGIPSVAGQPVARTGAVPTATWHSSATVAARRQRAHVLADAHGHHHTGLPQPLSDAPRPAPSAPLIDDGPHGAMTAGGQAVLLRECPICADDGGAVPGMVIGSCGHALCYPCGLRSLRHAMAPGASSAPCPSCVAERRQGGALGVFTPPSVDALAAWSRSPANGRPAGDLRPLSGDEIARFHRIAQRPLSTQHQLPGKRCPCCGTAVVRPRGHACHHIRACPGCRAEFCYACLGPYPCVNRCATFCDAACNCSDCLDCRPERPCELCDNDGRCRSCDPDGRGVPNHLRLRGAGHRDGTSEGGPHRDVGDGTLDGAQARR